MKHDPNVHHRRSVRLKGYGYFQPGTHFVTICTRNRTCLFGGIACGEMRLNEVGRIVSREWIETAGIRNGLNRMIWVVTPNHFRAILVIADDVGRMVLEPPPQSLDMATEWPGSMMP